MVEDRAQRKRLQNRMAQRSYRSRMKQRVQALEQEVNQYRQQGPTPQQEAPRAKENEPVVLVWNARARNDDSEHVDGARYETTNGVARSKQQQPDRTQKSVESTMRQYMPRSSDMTSSNPGSGPDEYDTIFVNKEPDPYKQPKGNNKRGDANPNKIHPTDTVERHDAGRPGVEELDANGNVDNSIMMDRSGSLDSFVNFSSSGMIDEEEGGPMQSRMVDDRVLDESYDLASELLNMKAGVGSQLQQGYGPTTRSPHRSPMRLQSGSNSATPSPPLLQQSALSHGNMMNGRTPTSSFPCLVSPLASTFSELSPKWTWPPTHHTPPETRQLSPELTPQDQQHPLHGRSSGDNKEMMDMFGSQGDYQLDDTGKDVTTTSLQQLGSKMTPQSVQQHHDSENNLMDTDTRQHVSHTSNNTAGVTWTADRAPPAPRNPADGPFSMERPHAVPGQPPSPPHIQPIAKRSLEDRFLYISQCIKEAGFQDFDQVIGMYYTSQFNHESSISREQRESRRNRLGHTLQTLREEVATWTQWEAHGFQSQMINSARDMISSERQHAAPLAERLVEVAAMSTPSRRQSKDTLGGQDAGGYGALSQMLQKAVPKSWGLAESLTMSDNNFDYRQQSHLTLAVVLLLCCGNYAGALSVASKCLAIVSGDEKLEKS